MSQVFISYAHKNDKFVAVLKKQLSDAGFDPMVDTDFLRAGEDWRQEIDSAIRGSFALIAVMSPDAFESKYVTYEWAFALGIGIKVIPLMLEQTKLHPRLDTLQYIPFDDHFSLDKSWEKLINRLKQIETDYKLPLNINASDLPSRIKGAINLLNDETYFYTTSYNQIDNMNNSIATLATSTHPTARKALIDVLEHPHRDARLTTIRAFGTIQDEKSFEPIILRLHDLDPEVRGTAAETLGRFGNAKATSELLKSLKDDQVFVRSNAAEALGRIGDERATIALMKLFEDQAKKVRRSAKEALKQIGTPEALNAVQKYEIETPAWLDEILDDSEAK